MVASSSERASWVDFHEGISSFRVDTSDAAAITVKSARRKERYRRATTMPADLRDHHSIRDPTLTPIAPPSPLSLRRQPSKHYPSSPRYSLQPVNPSPNHTNYKRVIASSAVRDSRSQHTLQGAPKLEMVSARNRTCSTSSSGSSDELPPAPQPSRPSPQATSNQRPTPTSREASATTPLRTSNSSQSSRGRSSQRSSATTSSSGSFSQIQSTVQPSRARSSSRLSAHRGRSKSQSRPPPTRNNHHQNYRARSRSRSRSASLTRVTGPGTVVSAPRSVPGVTATGPPSRGNTPRGVHSVGPGITFEECQRGTAIGFEFSFDKDEPHVATNDGRSSRPSATNAKAKHKTGIIDKLFGVPSSHSSAPTRRPLQQPSIRPRVLLAATVYYNTATNLWITTINTNQRGVARDPATANRYLQAFSFPTEREAREAAIANAPPKMVPFDESPECFMCRTTFAVFRRAAHCRNCGVCVCHPCSTAWPSQTLPPTYNLKKEGSVRVCKSCHALSGSFKKALLEGNYEEAVALYGTGNVNLRTPFPVSNKKDEILYPVHCAVEGGNLDVIRWLLDDHHCPIQRVRSKGRLPRGNSSGNPTADHILTSKGRSVLSIALENAKVDVMRYLVVECGVSIYDSTNLKSALRALEATLSALPSCSSVPKVADPRLGPATLLRGELPSPALWDRASFDDASESSNVDGADEDSSRPHDLGSKKSGRTRRSQRSSGRSVGASADKDEVEEAGDVPMCILCFDRQIDCRCRPCGHEICCSECASRLSACPICGGSGAFAPITGLE